jgi:hypothetical protein
LLTLYADHFDRDGNPPAEPTPPPAIQDDKLDVALRHAHDLLDIAQRGSVLVEYRQTGK